MNPNTVKNPLQTKPSRVAGYVLQRAIVHSNPCWARCEGHASSAVHAINIQCYCLWCPHFTASHLIVYIEHVVFVKQQKNSEVSCTNLAKGPTEVYKN